MITKLCPGAAYQVQFSPRKIVVDLYFLALNYKIVYLDNQAAFNLNIAKHSQQPIVWNFVKILAEVNEEYIYQ